MEVTRDSGHIIHVGIVFGALTRALPKQSAKWCTNTRRDLVTTMRLSNPDECPFVRTPLPSHTLY